MVENCAEASSRERPSLMGIDNQINDLMQSCRDRGLELEATTEEFIDYIAPYAEDPRFERMINLGAIALRAYERGYPPANSSSYQ